MLWVLLRPTRTRLVKVLWDGSYSFSSLPEKTKKSNHLQMSVQKRQFLWSCQGLNSQPWGDTQGLHCKYPGELHTIPYNFVIRNCMELSRRLFFISLGAADFVTYDHREVFFPTPFCQENVIIWKQTRHDRVGRPKPAKIKGFSSSISEASFVSIWSK